MKKSERELPSEQNNRAHRGQRNRKMANIVKTLNADAAMIMPNAMSNRGAGTGMGVTPVGGEVRATSATAGNYNAIDQLYLLRRRQKPLQAAS